MKKQTLAEKLNILKVKAPERFNDELRSGFSDFVGSEVLLVGSWGDDVHDGKSLRIDKRLRKEYEQGSCIYWTQEGSKDRDRAYVHALVIPHSGFSEVISQITALYKNDPKKVLELIQAITPVGKEGDFLRYEPSELLEALGIESSPHLKPARKFQKGEEDHEFSQWEKAHKGRVQALKKYFRAVLGEKPVRKAEFARLSKKVSPLIDHKFGGLSNRRDDAGVSAWDEFKGHNDLVKLSKRHKDFVKKWSKSFEPPEF